MINMTGVHETANHVSAADEYFHRSVLQLHESPGIHQVGNRQEHEHLVQHPRNNIFFCVNPRDKTMANKLICISNDDKQNYSVIKVIGLYPTKVLKKFLSQHG